MKMINIALHLALFELYLHWCTDGLHTVNWG